MSEHEQQEATSVCCPRLGMGALLKWERFTKGQRGTFGLMDKSSFFAVIVLWVNMSVQTYQIIE